MINIFSLRLRKLRKQKNLQQENLAQILKISQRTISNWEKSEAEPSFNFLKQIAKIFNVSIDYLMGFDKKTLDLIFNYRKQKIEDIENGIDNIETYSFKTYLKKIEKLEKNGRSNGQTVSDYYIELLSLERDLEEFIILQIENAILEIEAEQFRDVSLSYLDEIAKDFQVRKNNEKKINKK